MVPSSGDSGEGGGAGTGGRKHGDAGPSVTSPTTAARPPTRAQMRDRAAGAIIGAVVGEALGMGIHWQYDLDQLHRDRGYVRDYTTPLPGTYHAGQLVAGQTTLPGEITHALLESLAMQHALDQDDFHRRVDEILRHGGIDGTRQGGRWGWTDKVICELYRARVGEGRAWAECVAPRSDTTDTIVRAALVAARYHASPTAMYASSPPDDACMLLIACSRGALGGAAERELLRI
jgi:ADP-ribosylglycohydrolase